MNDTTNTSQGFFYLALYCMIGESVLWREGGKGLLLVSKHAHKSEAQMVLLFKKQSKIKQVIIATKDNS